MSNKEKVEKSSVFPDVEELQVRIFDEAKEKKPQTVHSSLRAIRSFLHNTGIGQTDRDFEKVLENN